MVLPREKEICTLEITGYGSDGGGVSRLENGQTIFVKGALRDEVCRVRIDKMGKSAAWGEAVEILTPSPHRISSDCPYDQNCGGCQLRQMTYEEELRFKKDRVQEALRRLGGVEVTVSAIHGAKEPCHYRNKVQFPVSKDAIGFYRQRSHEVVDVSDCLLQPPEATRLRDAVKNWMARFAIPAYEEKTHEGLLRHLFVRVNEKGQSLCCLVVNGKKLPREEELVEMLRGAEENLVGIVLSVNTEKTNVILGRRYRTLWGQDYLEDTLCGLSFRLSVPSFYQVNRIQAEVLYTRALEFADLKGTETVLDLYCGIGTITLCMAKKAGLVFGAEVVEEAVQDARENAARNGIENAEFLCGDAGEAAKLLAGRGIRPQVVCVDPPRKGLAPEVIDTILEMAPARVVYVSCDPGTLGRDVKRFAQGGYEVSRAEACDLFPRTVHIESVVLLTKSGTK